MKIKQRLTPFLSYRDRAEEAADFYVSIIPDSRIIRKVVNPSDQSVLTVEFEMCGMKTIALNAGQQWEFTEAFSLAIVCDSQEEIDRLWNGLLGDGGQELACGWLKDPFGMCWQVWPSVMEEWFATDNPAGLQRMFEALWQMKKLDIAALTRAYAGNE
ncbi:MAG: VOC family protein [Rhodopirellula sp. JB044]|uniref:VOC family protein n=1 Tax=Rhodopirellula sp. JB044 TaxID=3342844 RepID=UPI00370B1FB6